MGPLIGTKSQLWLMDGKSPWAQVETCHTGVKRAQVVLKWCPGISQGQVYDSLWKQAS